MTKTRPRRPFERDSSKMPLDDLLSGPVGGVGLAGHHDLHRALGPTTGCGRGAPRRGTAGRRACRSRSGARSRWSARRDRARRAPRAAPSATRRGGRAGVRGGPRGSRSSRASAARWALHSSASSSCVQVGELLRTVEVDLERHCRTAALTSRRTGRPSQVGTWTPFVMPSIGCPASSCHVSVAVRACSCDTAFALLAWRSTKAVMSKGAFGSSVWPRPSSSSSSGSMRAACEPRLQRRRDEVTLEDLVAGRNGRVDREDRVATRRDGAPRAAARPGSAATSSRARSRSRNAEWPSLRCQTAGSMPRARSARTPPIPSTSSWHRRISRPRT